MAKAKFHTAQQVEAILAEVKSQTDRGAAVVSAALLDDLLRILLEERLIKLSGDRIESLFERTNAPLSGFSNRIEMAFALGIISNDARLALHLVRDIRNKFAHRIEQLSFDEPEIVNLIETRGTKSTKSASGTCREKFNLMFQGLAGVIYGTLAAPTIRIESLEKTHAVYFLNMALEMAKVVGAEIPERWEAQAKAAAQAKPERKP